MKNWKKGILAGCMVLCCLAAPAAEAAMSEGAQNRISARQTANAELDALLWMRTAAEYRALCYQGYNMALSAVDRALADPSKRNGKPLAIVLDCDETVVSNNNAMSESVAAGEGRFTGLWWRNTVHAARSEAMPGATEFLTEVHRRGVEIFYVTNRWSVANYDATVKNLKALKFPTVDRKHLLMMDDTKASDKQPRFEKVAKEYDVIVYLGDNIGDLPLRTKGKNRAERDRIIDGAKGDFGTLYVLFPNPAYGSWITALSKEYLTMTPEVRAEFYRKVLTK
jgi:5'-nucleotidase (lipoprotein e(P4) family)